LDALRFVAFLMVYLGHAVRNPLSSHAVIQTAFELTGIGVPLFFTLSAYLITELLVREKRATGTLQVRAFYIRRILRICPLYFFTLAAGLVASRLHPAWRIPPAAVAAYLLLAGNWYTAYHGYLSAGISPLWTISVEEQFYLVWPLFLRSLRRRSLILICGLAWCVSQLALILLCLRHANGSEIWPNSFVHLQYFALGAGLSLLLNGTLPKIGGASRFLMIAASLLPFYGVTYVLDRDVHGDVTTIGNTYLVYLVIGLATVGILAGFLGSQALGKVQPLRYLGKISYGLYVFHYECLIAARKIVPHVLHRGVLPGVIIVGLILCVGMAHLSYHWLERPFLLLKQRREIVVSRPV
jgi:peptidoglycan/LPS O-acetylase OafA/YrhL